MAMTYADDPVSDPRFRPQRYTSEREGSVRQRTSLGARLHLAAKTNSSPPRCKTPTPLLSEQRSDATTAP